MPLDFTMLLGASPPAATFVPFEVVPSPFDDSGGILADSEPPYACRRVATFPMVNRHAPKPSNLKYRSLSESTDLHKLRSCISSDSFSLADFKRELHMLLEEEHHHGQQHQKECEVVGGAGPSSPIALSNEDESNGEQHRRKKSRKKVAFADDRGLQLTSVRVMTEPSDVPPKINPAIIRALLGDQYDEEEAKAGATWTINFKQPASEYVAFRQKLDSQFVSVENVLVKNDQCRLVGTVKVKNMAFEKEVYIRLTDNEWKSYFDRPCKYSTNRCGDAYDTFQFDIEIPHDDPAHQRIEFCVCYKTNGQEFWDSNDGKNYEIISEALRLQRSQTQAPACTNGGKGEEEANGRNRYYGKPVLDAMALNCTNWTEFASWSDLSTHGPYW